MKRLFRIGSMMMVLPCAIMSGLSAFGSLSEHSPFLPPGQNETKPLPSTAKARTPVSKMPQLTLRGVMQLGGREMLSIQNESSGKSVWVEVNGHAMGVNVIAYDSSQRCATLMYQGQRVQLSMADVEGSTPSTAFRGQLSEQVVQASSLSSMTNAAGPGETGTIAFEKLNPRLRALYLRGDHADDLRRAGVRGGPGQNKQSQSSESQAAELVAQERQNAMSAQSAPRQRKNPTVFTQPTINNALTAAEKALRRQQLGYNE
ncbi:MAG: hypothetical protein ACQKBW_10570 [Puniceicoccales bacterium]